jgi:hypothetical protein
MVLHSCQSSVACRNLVHMDAFSIVNGEILRAASSKNNFPLTKRLTADSKSLNTKRSVLLNNDLVPV